MSTTERKNRFDLAEAEQIAQAHTAAGNPLTVEDVLALEDIDFSDWNHARLYDTVMQACEEIARREGKRVGDVTLELAMGTSGGAMQVVSLEDIFGAPEPPKLDD